MNLVVKHEIVVMVGLSAPQLHCSVRVRGEHELELVQKVEQLHAHDCHYTEYDIRPQNITPGAQPSQQMNMRQL